MRNNALRMFVDFMDAPEHEYIGICGAKMVNGNEEPALSRGQFPSLSSEISYLWKKSLRVFFPKQNGFWEEPAGNFAVDYISGADMFTRAELFHKLEGFDPAFFMYYEETDLNKRAAKMNYRSYIIDGPDIVHLEGGSDSEKKKFSFFMLAHSARGVFMYIKKHERGVSFALFFTFMLLARLALIFSRGFSFREKRGLIRLLWWEVFHDRNVPVKADFYKEFL